MKRKRTAHAYFGRPYFSKSFGGKIQPFSNRCYREATLNNLSMRVANTRIFFKFFGGKIKFLNNRLLGSYGDDQKNSTGLNRFFGIFANKIDLSLMKNQLRCFQKTLDLFCCRIFFLPLTCPLFCT